MKWKGLRVMKCLALLCLCPGLGGASVSAMLSTHYLATLPERPDPATAHIFPRDIHGTTIYQTPQEDLRLTIAEWSSFGCIFIGLLFGVVYLEMGEGIGVDSEQDRKISDPSIQIVYQTVSDKHH